MLASMVIVNATTMFVKNDCLVTVPVIMFSSNVSKSDSAKHLETRNRPPC